MALNKSGLLSLIASELPDNGNEEITAADLRTVLSQMVDSDLNLLEPTENVKINSRVIINQASDFDPYLVGSTYVLAPFTQYYIGANIVVDYNFDLSAGNIVIISQAATGSITYTGTGDMITAVDCGLGGVSDIILSQPNALPGDAIFNVSDSAAPFSTFNLRNFVVGECDTFLVGENVFALTIDFGAAPSANNGIIINGTGLGTLSLEKILIVSTSASFVGVDLGANVYSAFEADNLQLIAPPGAVGISGLANNGNIAPGQIGSIENCEFIAGIAPLAGITEDDFRYSFNGNAGIKDTSPGALISLTGNTTNTIINTAGVAEVIAGTWMEESASHFTTDAAGRITYDGERPVTLNIGLRVSLEPVSGTNKTLTACIALNGVNIPESCSVLRVDSGSPLSSTALWQITFNNGDYVEGVVTNESDTTNILVSSSVLRIG